MKVSVVFCLFLASILATSSGGIDPMHQKVIDFIRRTNNLFFKSSEDKQHMPDWGVQPSAPIKLRSGTIGLVGTMFLKQDPDITERKNQDNSTTYYFDVMLGLRQFMIDYFWIFSDPQETGNIKFVPMNNSTRVKVTAEVVPGKYCKAELKKMEIDKLEDYVITLDNQSTWSYRSNQSIIDSINKYISPTIVHKINVLMNDTFAMDDIKKEFSKMVCQDLI